MDTHGGEVTMSSGFQIERDPDTVLAPDVAFVRAERSVTAEGRFYPSFPPDVAVIVVGWPDTAVERRPNIRRYLEAGSRIVVFAETEARVVAVERGDGRSEVLREGDVFDGGDVMPGFRLAVAEFFR
jgi:putative restriction endonuclease